MKDISLRAISLEQLPLVKRLRRDHFRTKPAVCIERAKWITRYMQNPGDPKDPPILMRARAVNLYLSNREALFLDDNLLAGSTTSKPIGAPVYPELVGLTIWPELDTISTRKVNPLTLSKADAKLLNLDVFPYWMDRNVQEVTRKKFNNPECMRLFERIVFYINGKAGCISHCVPSYKTVLHQGLASVQEEARRLEAKAAEEGGKSESRVAFYQAAQTAIDGILRYASNLSKKAAQLAEQEGDQARKENLRIMSETCARVPAQPARTFREAVNSLWLCQVAMHAENINMAMSPGRLDQVLYPFYKRDIDQKTLTEEEALKLCCCLWLKIADNTNLAPEQAEQLWGGAGSTPAVTLGGVDEEGEDAVNDLTYILLKTTELMALRDPSVNARYSYEKNDRRYLERVSEVILNTRAIPALHNDIPAIKALVNQGEDLKHARDFAIVGCVELASTGRDYPSSSSIMFNLAAPLEMALLDGRRLVTGDKQIGPRTGDPTTFTNFDQFWTAFTAQLKWLIEQAITMNENLGVVHQEMLPTPLLSAFFEGPMQKGLDLVFGGAPYNSSGASHVAFPDVCDSLNAIEFAVFIEKKLTMQEMVDAIRQNFAPPYDKHLLFLKNKAPKFGTEHPVALKNSRMLVKFIYDVYQSHMNYRGGRYRPAYWTMTTHAGQGKLAGALPSGRKAKEVFSSGITPASQASRDVVAVYNSVAALEADTYIPGGQALNIKYTPPISGSEGEYLKKFADHVEGYFRQGGLQAQYNVQTYEALIEAKKYPKRHPEMIVRVSGYSAYFKDLNPAMKEELITRTQYNLMNNQSVPLPPSWSQRSNATRERALVRKKVTKKLNVSQKRSLSDPLKKLAACLEGESLDNLLELLLEGMRLAFIAVPSYRANIKGFQARYGFRSNDGTIACAAEFGSGLGNLPCMKVHREMIDKTNVTINFKDSRALRDFLFAKNPDVFGAIIENAIVFDGNMYYLLKFAHMARQLQLHFPHFKA